MSKEMNKLLRQMVKYDLISGLLISLLMAMFCHFKCAEIFFIGICVSLINFLINGYTISKCLGNNKQWLIMISYFFRIGFVALTIVPLKSVTYASYYMAGFISHYIILIISNLKNRKGSA